MRVGKPLLMLPILNVSLAWSIGVATLVIGHLSLFSVMFISIVIGIGIDYGIYFLFRYEEELFLGRSLREAIEITAARSGPGMLLGAVTAAGTFFVLMLTDFRGLQELGFISGTAILLAWVAMITVFPAVLVVVDRRHAATQRRAHSARHAAGEHARALRGPDHPASAHGPGHRGHPDPARPCGDSATCASTTTSSTCRPRARNPWCGSAASSPRPGAPASPPWPAPRPWTSCEKKRDAFAKLPSVSEVDSALLFIPSDQPQKLQDHPGLRGAGGPGADRPRRRRSTCRVWSTELESLQRRLDIAAARRRRARSEAS